LYSSWFGFRSPADASKEIDVSKRLGISLTEIWTDPQTIHWAQILLDSYRQLVGCELLDRSQSPIEQSRLLYLAPFVVVSHDTQPDPVFNYGNQVALDLWEIDWATLLQTHSKATAEPVNRAIRQEMLAQARSHGLIQNYQGVRISTSGRRFAIDQATIWNLIDTTGQPCGQAATFATWQYL
jgi:MEKHLA domain